MPMTEAPAQRIVPIMTLNNTVANLRNVCTMYCPAFISFLIFYLCGFESWGSWVSFSFSPLVIRHFFYASSGRFGRFRFSCPINEAVGENKVFWTNTTRQRRRGDFFKNRRLDLVVPAKPVVSFATDNGTPSKRSTEDGYGGWRNRGEIEKENHYAFARIKEKCMGYEVCRTEPTIKNCPPLRYSRIES